MTEQSLWQLQNALATAERNLTDRVTIAAWPDWIRYLLVGLDTFCQANGFDGDGMLGEVRDLVDGRLQAGRW